MQTGKTVDRVSGPWPDQLRDWALAELSAGGGNLVGRAQAELERVLIDCVLEQTGGQRIKAAELLGLGRNTLTRKLKLQSEQDELAEESSFQRTGST
jgi:two-component system nitrogen regulation response regulator GlnG